MRLRFGLLIFALLLALACPTAANASAPYLGIDTWYGYGANINEQTIVDLTDSTVARGLRAAGYRYIWLDAGWWYGQRDINGRIVVDPALWPRGMTWMVNYIHSHGFLAGIYTDLGVAACHSGGSIGHFQQDVNQFAAWGFDAVKVDACGAYSLPDWNPEQMFGAFEQAIVHDSPHRLMLLNVGNGDNWSAFPLTVFDDYAWASKFPEPTSWRTQTDLSYPGTLTFAHVLRNIDADAMHPAAAGNGHWNDPDYLAPTLLSPTEAQAQYTMWAILAAPMMVSVDVPNAPQYVINMMENPEVNSISQDALGIQGRRVARIGSVDVWVKPLVDHREAVALLNRGTRRAHVVVMPHTLGHAVRWWSPTCGAVGPATRGASEPSSMGIAPRCYAFLSGEAATRCEIDAPHGPA